MLTRPPVVLLGVLLLAHTFSLAPQPQAAVSGAGSLTITGINLEARVATDASGIWVMSTGDILTVMETEGGVVGLQLRGNLSALVVLLGSVSGNQLALTSLDGASTLEATVSGASMSGTLTQPGPSIEFSAARALAPIGSSVDGVYQSDLGNFLLHFSTDSDDIPVVVFDVALVGAGISFDIFLGDTAPAAFSPTYVGNSIFGTRTLRMRFNGSLRATGTYSAAATTSFAASSLLRFCPNASDFDADGVVDDCDRCPDDADPSQADSDADGAGDACDICNGADDFADVVPDRDPDCLAALGDFAGNTGTYAVESFSRADCWPRGTRFELRLVPGTNPRMDICDLPENSGCQDTVVSGNTAVADSVTFSGHGPHDLTIMTDDLVPEPQRGDDDDDAEKLDYVLGDNFFPMECNGGAVGPFASLNRRVCRYLATFEGSCPGFGATQELCIDCKRPGKCPKASTGTYSILLGTSTGMRECRAQLSRIGLSCGRCSGLRAVRRPDED